MEWDCQHPYHGRTRTATRTTRVNCEHTWYSTTIRVPSTPSWLTQINSSDNLELGNCVFHRTNGNGIATGILRLVEDLTERKKLQRVVSESSLGLLPHRRHPSFDNETCERIQGMPHGMRMPFMENNKEGEFRGCVEVASPVATYCGCQVAIASVLEQSRMPGTVSTVAAAAPRLVESDHRPARNVAVGRSRVQRINPDHDHTLWRNRIVPFFQTTTSSPMCAADNGDLQRPSDNLSGMDEVELGMTCSSNFQVNIATDYLWVSRSRGPRFKGNKKS